MGRIVVFGILACWPALALAQDLDARQSRLRSPDAALSRALNEAVERSATFRRLVDRLETGRAFVYVTPSVALSMGLEACLLHAVGGSAESRYLRVLVRWGLPPEYLIAVVAHELQHVVEVLEAPGANDSTSMERLFQRIGLHRRLGPERTQYETSAAIAIQAQVFAELRSDGRIVALRRSYSEQDMPLAPMAGVDRPSSESGLHDPHAAVARPHDDGPIPP